MRMLVHCIWLFLPAGVANTIPPVLTKLIGAGRPISASWFGAHKTWQGLIGGTIAGVGTHALQRIFDPTLRFDAALAMSVGALLGDLAKSFVKRRVHIAPGKAWFPFDQIDYVIGALIATAPFIHLTLAEALTTIAAFVALHLIVSAIGFLVRVKEHPI